MALLMCDLLVEAGVIGAGDVSAQKLSAIVAKATSWRTTPNSQQRRAATQIANQAILDALSKVSRLPQHFDAFPGLNPPNRPKAAQASQKTLLDWCARFPIVLRTTMD